MLAFNALCYFSGNTNFCSAPFFSTFYSYSIFIPFFSFLFLPVASKPPTQPMTVIFCFLFLLSDLRDKDCCEFRFFLIFSLFSHVFSLGFSSILLQFFGEHLDVEGLEHGRSSLELGYGPLLSTESQRSEEEQALFSTPSLEDRMPFLQMLQSVESPPFSPFTEPNFQALLRLQHQKKPWGMTHLTELDSRIQARELESCITHDILEMHSPVKSETKEPQHHQHSTPCLEGTSSECNQDQPNSAENGCLDTNSGSSPAWVQPQTRQKQAHLSKSPPITRERRKRKRTRPTKNKEEVESQRMTHIAVERNRRRQMNDHLNALRSLMPTSYIQRVILQIFGILFELD